MRLTFHFLLSFVCPLVSRQQSTFSNTKKEMIAWSNQMYWSSVEEENELAVSSSTFEKRHCKRHQTALLPLMDI